MNQTLEYYLRCYVNYEQDDWAALLPSAEFAYNDSQNASTGMSPFAQVYRFMPEIRINIAREPREHENESAKVKAIELHRSQEDSEELWQRTQRATEKYYNKKHMKKVFAVGDLVLVAAKHIRTIRVSKKLADRNIGPFEVLERKGQNAYTLRLPQKYGRLHPTFHVSLLELYRLRKGSDIPEPIDIDGIEEWEVERILDSHTSKNGVKRYLVRWKGFSEADDTWEVEKHLENARELVNDYESYAKRMRILRGST